MRAVVGGDTQRFVFCRTVEKAISCYGMCFNTNNVNELHGGAKKGKIGEIIVEANFEFLAFHRLVSL